MCGRYDIRLLCGVDEYTGIQRGLSGMEGSGSVGEIPIISGIDRGSTNSINLDKLAAAKAAAAFWIRPGARR